MPWFAVPKAAERSSKMRTEDCAAVPADF